MFNRMPPAERALALMLVGCGVLGGGGWLWWRAERRSDTNFLPHRAPAEWIVYPTAPDLSPRPRLELSTVFTRSFVLDQAPASATLSIAGFHRYAVAVNGQAPAAPVRAGRYWKEPDQFGIGAALRAGENQLAVTVFNTNGPPALWLSLVSGTFRLASDESWECSYAGAAWRKARLASSTRLVPAGCPGFDGERPWPSLRARWPTLLVFAVLAAAGYWMFGRIGSSRPHTPHSALRTPHSTHLPLLVAGAAWLALFVNNAGVLPAQMGFDFGGHRAYIQYLLDHGTLPQAGLGWEMYQPPLYYLVCALLLKLLSLSTTDPGGLLALRWLGFGIGLVHLVLLWGTLRLLFPNQRASQGAGLVLAAALPPLLYMAQYLSNEAPAAALYSACLYLALRALGRERASWRLCVALGLCLGATLVAKASAVLLLPPIIGALVWKAFRPNSAGPHPWLSRAGVVLAVSLAIGGWHYGHMWLRYGNPLIGSWDPKVGFAWWAHNGYQTVAHYLRFGSALTCPWFSGLNSFPDNLYSTLWGDGQWGGAAVRVARPPWNYDLMALGYWLALVPTLAAILGGFLAVVRFMRKPTPEWFMVLGLFYLTLLGLVSLSLDMPAFALSKAFYGFPALVPFCAFVVVGLESLWHWNGRLRPVLSVAFCVWALNSYASFWIARSSGQTQTSRAWLLSREGHVPEALRLLQARLEREPRDGQARWVRALALLKARQREQAAEQAELLVREEPGNGLGHLALATALLEGGQLEPATAQARRAVELAPGYGAAYECLATLLLQQERYAECEPVARQGLGVVPFSAQLRLALGASLLGRASDAEAAAQMQLAFRLNRNWPEGYVLVARALAGHGRLDEAATCLAQAVGLQPKDAQIHYQLAQVLDKRGRTEEAMAAAKRARELALAAGQQELARNSERLLEEIAARKSSTR